MSFLYSTTFLLQAQWVSANQVDFLVADYSNGGAEIFFASHLEHERKPLMPGDNFKGEVTLKLVSQE